MSDSARPYTPTALPPVLARALAFAAILIAGLCGGLIGWSVIDLQCAPDREARVLRAMAEWRKDLDVEEPPA
jgi:hypothetical protein